MSTVKSVQLPNGDTYNLSGAPVPGASTPLIKNIQLPNGDTYPIGTDLITPLTVTENGTYTPESPYDGFSSVTVNVGSSALPELIINELRLPYGSISGTNLTIDPSKVTISGTNMDIGTGLVTVDEDLIPSNIKKDVEIFGVVGEYEVLPTPLNPLSVGTLGTFYPPQGEGFSEVTVEDADCIASNIREGVNILGVTGTVHEGITPSGKIDITNTSEYDVTNAAKAQISSTDRTNLVASNIKEGVTILGVTGTVHEGITPSGEKSITSTASTDVANYSTARIDSTSRTNLVASNIKEGVTILGVTGTLSSGKNTQCAPTMYRCTGTSLATTNITLTVSVAGTYNIYWMSYYAYTSTSTNAQTRIYKNGSAIGSTVTAPIYNNSTASNLRHSLTNQTLAKGDTITLYARAYSSSRPVYTGMLMIVQQ